MATELEVPISREIYEQTYKFRDDKNVSDTQRRNARALAEAEGPKNQHYYEEVFYNTFQDFKFLTGGRIIANAGADLDKATLINCFSGDTEILTGDKGRVSIKSLEGEKAELLTRNGKWVKAPVKRFGKQRLMKITLRRNRSEKIVYATPNHRWFVYTKAVPETREVTTEDLQSHHRLETVRSRRHTSVSPSPIGIARGFTFGDGSTRDRNYGSNVNLVGSKDEVMKKYFVALPESFYDYSTGVTRINGLPNSWRDLISLTENTTTLYGWISGYFAADGCVSESGEVIMDSCKKENIEHYIDILEILGIDHYGIKSQDRISNLTEEESTRYYVRLNPSSLREEFFILPKHRERFNKTDRELTYHWNVVSVEDTQAYEEVYCAQVEDEHAFALSGGILTGNCFVDGFTGYDQDSMEGIQRALTRQSLILVSEGGYGFCADVMRPRGSYVNGIGILSPGSVQMLNMWDTQSRTITEGSGMQSDREDVKEKVRKGAQMVTMSIWHPDIREFITAKQEQGRLEKFNMSVLISDEFMAAVDRGDGWDLKFPDYEADMDLYKEEWDGNLSKWERNGYPVKVYDTVPANELWNLIMESTYNRNEPGVLFVDTINRMNNLSYTGEFINATNPCVAEGTLVNTHSGYQKVENISVGDNISTVMGTEPVKEIERHENYPVYRVKFSDGGEQVVTEAHQYHVKDNGAKSITTKPLSKVSIGDTVRVRGDHQPFDFNPSEYERGLKKGILLGDGCYTKDALAHNNRIAVSTSMEDSTYNEKVKSLFNTTRKLDTSNEGKAAKIWLMDGQSLIDELDLEGAKSHAKTLDVSTMSKSEMIGALDGMIASDGNINLKSNHPQIRYKSTSKVLAQSFRAMMIAVGAHTTISQKEASNGLINGRVIKGRYDQYTAGVSGESIRNFCKYSRLLKIHPKKGKRLKKAQTEFLLSGNYWHTKVESIEPAGKANVYDLYCEESDTWITEGYVQRGCGEQILPIGGVCLLGSLNLTQFVTQDRQWDYDKLERVIPNAVRMMDNVNDIAYVPLPEQQEQLQSKRRIGLGIMGLGSALLMRQMRFGNSHAVNETDRLMDYIKNKAYQASALLAKEKEPFPLFDKEKYMNQPFIQRLWPETRQMIADYGIRNSHLLSIQPTGNSSTYANNVSGGQEPVFAFSTARTSEQPYAPEGLIRPVDIDWSKQGFDLNPHDMKSAHDSDIPEEEWTTNWKWITEGDTPILKTTHEGRVWKYEKNRGLMAEMVNEDYGVRWLKERDEWDPEAPWAAKAGNLSVDAHVKMMEAIAKHIDSAMSKTVNLPEDYPFEEFKNLYRDMWETGEIKGGTSYRNGTMATVLRDEDERDESHLSEERPTALQAETFGVKANGREYIVAIGLMEEHPYEIFASPVSSFERNSRLKEELFSGHKESVIRKDNSGDYKIIINGQTFPVGDEAPSIDGKDLSTERAMTRHISLALRSGVPIYEICEQLDKSEGTIVSFSTVIRRCLSQFMDKKEALSKNPAINPECPDEEACNVVFQEGCKRCLTCGYSGCN